MKVPKNRITVFCGNHPEIKNEVEHARENNKGTDDQPDWYWHAERNGQVVAIGGEGYDRAKHAARSAKKNGPADLRIFYALNDGTFEEQPR